MMDVGTGDLIKEKWILEKPSIDLTSLPFEI
jgi:hypothetical protein